MKAERVTEYKYLGTVLDNKLNFNQNNDFIHKRSISISTNVLFYVCSHRDDIRQKQKAKNIIYTHFPTGL